MQLDQWRSLLLFPVELVHVVFLEEKSNGLFGNR